jgi:general secretion pathway protein C
VHRHFCSTKRLEILAMIIPAMQSSSLYPIATAWPVRLVTFVLAAAAAASVGFWILRWPATETSTRPVVPQVTQANVDTAKLGQLLGAGAGKDSTTPLVTITQYQLLGVISHGGHWGSALIGIDGQPPKPYRVGDRLSDQVVLKSVMARSIVLASDMNASDGISVEMPTLPGTP